MSLPYRFVVVFSGFLLHDAIAELFEAEDNSCVRRSTDTSYDVINNVLI